MCSRDVILELRSVRWELSAQVRSTVERAGCGGTCRGRRAGKHVKARRHCIAYSETSDGEIPVLSTTCRRRSNSGRAALNDHWTLGLYTNGRSIVTKRRVSRLLSVRVAHRCATDTEQ